MQTNVLSLPLSCALKFHPVQTASQEAAARPLASRFFSAHSPIDLFFSIDTRTVPP